MINTYTFCYTLNHFRIKVIKFFGKIDSLKYYTLANLGLTIIRDDFYKDHFNYIFSDSSEIFIKSDEESDENWLILVYLKNNAIYITLSRILF